MSHERKRQVETELANAVKNTKPADLDRPITSAEVAQACRTLKNRKAPGKDGITNEIIRASLPEMCSVLNKTLQRHPKHRSQPRLLEDRGICPYL